MALVKWALVFYCMYDTPHTQSQIRKHRFSMLDKKSNDNLTKTIYKHELFI